MQNTNLVNEMYTLLNRGYCEKFIFFFLNIVQIILWSYQLVSTCNTINKLHI